MLNEVRNTSLAYMRRGTQRVPVVARRQCKTCMSPHRNKIERLFIDGVTPGRIIARLPRGQDLSERGIRRHHNRGHCPADHTTVLRRVNAAEQKRWDEIGHDGTEVEIERALRDEAILQVGLYRTELDEIPLSAEDLLSAAARHDRREELARVHEHELDQRAHARDLVVRDLRFLLEIVGEVLGDDARNEVFHRAAIDRRTSTTLTDAQFVELRERKDCWVDSMSRDERRHVFDATSRAA